MQEILVKAGCFIAIIVMGYVLRKVNFFKEEDFTVLSKIVLKITLPAAIVSSFTGKVIDPLMFAIALLGLGAGLIYMLLAYVMNIRKGKEQQAFMILNLSGYNIGNFALPFVQSFLGPVGVITTSLFDTGNACVCLGGAYSVAATVKENKGFSVKRILKTLSKSVAFNCYVVMILLNILHINLPTPVVSLAEIIGNGNAFMAMLMLGVGFKISGNRSQIKDIVRILMSRYGMAAVFAAVFYFLLPFDLEVRQALVILAFGPIASANPAFTEELKEDVGLASAINSISIVCSIFIIVILLLVML